MMRRYALAITLGLVSAVGWNHATAGAASQAAGAGQAAATPSSGTSTRLADGHWLVVGDQSRNGGAWLWDPQTGTAQPTPGSVQVPRIGHTATLLPDGSVLIIGGRNDGASVGSPELFDPATGTFTLLPMVGATARAAHTATLTTDGRVLVTGGSDGGVTALPTEIWDVAGRTATGVGSRGINRSGHNAALTADGGVLVTGGHALDGSPAAGAEIVNPSTGTVQRATSQEERTVPIVTGSMPAPGATNISLDAHLTMRFSEALSVTSVSSSTVTLSGPDGFVVDTRVVAAEDGHLAFVWPVQRLAENTTYVLAVSGAMDRFGVPVIPASIAFTTIRLTDTSQSPDAEPWDPDAAQGRDGWRTNRPQSPWQKLEPLQAPPGVTALSGQVLRLNGQPLAHVTLQIDKHVGHTDATGRFLMRLDREPTAHAVVWIDGGTASRPAATYGSYEVGVSIVAGRTSVLPYTIWMPVLDTAHAVTFSSPTTTEVVVSTPTIPGLELRIPPNTVIRDHDGKVVTTVTITPVPLDRPPFPLPAGVQVPLYFTTQPGGATLSVSGTSGQRGARLIYPNGLHLPARTQMNFWRYEPDGPGWEVYGHGRVTSDGQQVVPNPGVEVYEFTGAMVAEPGMGASPAPPPNGKKGGDPVDLYTGLFVLQKTDLAVPDVMPLALTRTYRQADPRSRAFGIGATHPYDMFLVGDTFPYTYMELILEDGGRLHFDNAFPGNDWTTAVYHHVGTPTDWYQSSIVWNGNGWTLTKTDGTVLTFPEAFNATRPQQGALTRIQDRFGNAVTLTRDANANLTQIRSPNGRWIALTYDSSFRITQLQDNIGRTVGYTYDASGRLWKVTDPEGGVTEYTYDASHRMLTLKDARGLVFLTNEYDTSDRVAKQTLANAGTYQFDYSVDSQGHPVTSVTNPRGFVTRTTFNTVGYAISEVTAVGTTIERATTTERQPGSNFVTSVRDGMNRQTALTYDASGHVMTSTRLAGIAEAVTTTYTYEPKFGQLATVTDPLNHTWTMGYDTLGRLTSETDPLTHQTTLASNAQGQLTSVTDALQHGSQLGYTGGDLTSVTNPVNAVQRQFVDSVGRVVTTTDALGRQTRSEWDKLNRVTAVTDALGGQTSFTYDPNGNLLTLTDGLTHATTYAYDANDQVATRTDPLQRTAGYQYDANGQVTQATDRKGQVTSYQYDALDRRTRVTYVDASTIDYTYDLGDRLTQIVDSLNGTITRAYDGLNRVTSEASPTGTVSYTYDADGRRATMTVDGQSAVTYGYDNAHRLTSITHGTTTIGMTYDDADRRSALTLANGIVATYEYDSASHLTSLAYTLNGSPVGDLTYTYDAAGQRTGVGGSFARTGLPQALGSATVDAGNQLTASGGATLIYDLNGNLTSDGTISYTWNARNQLVGLSGGASASFAYDGLGRRRSKTIGATTTGFLYDGWNLVQELTGGGTPTANLLTGLDIDETFTRTDGGGTSTLIVDALGSTVEVADASGTMQTHYTYEPFGATTVSGTASGNAGQFTARENDGSGLYFYRMRYYSPVWQRFISEDPLGFDGGDVNLYSYAWNAPTDYVDPLGLCLPACAVPLILAEPEIAAGAAAASYAAWKAGQALAKMINDLATTYAQRGKQNLQDTALIDKSDAEISKLAKDRSLSGEERRRYQREDKWRQNRNKQKRGGDDDGGSNDGGSGGGARGGGGGSGSGSGSGGRGGSGKGGGMGGRKG